MPGLRLRARTSERAVPEDGARGTKGDAKTGAGTGSREEGTPGLGQVPSLTSLRGRSKERNVLSRTSETFSHRLVIYFGKYP